MDITTSTDTTDTPTTPRTRQSVELATDNFVTATDFPASASTGEKRGRTAGMIIYPALEAVVEKGGMVGQVVKIATHPTSPPILRIIKQFEKGELFVPAGSVWDLRKVRNVQGEWELWAKLVEVENVQVQNVEVEDDEDEEFEVDEDYDGDEDDEDDEDEDDE